MARRWLWPRRAGSRRTSTTDRSVAGRAASYWDEVQAEPDRNVDDCLRSLHEATDGLDRKARRQLYAEILRQASKK